MQVNEKTIAELAGQLGLKEPVPFSAAAMQQLQGKSDQELEQEILKIREQLAARGLTRPKQAAMLRSLLPMMDPKQRARLQKVIELIER